MRFQADYHIHHHLDSCAAAEMTLPNIDEAAHQMGFTEITVLAHGSSQLPFGKKDWGLWHQLNPQRFEAYMEEHRSFHSPHGLRILTGVETELIDQAGHVAVSEDVANRIDMVALSLHYLPELDIFSWMPDEYPSNRRTEAQKAQFEVWRQEMSAIPTEDVLAAVVEAYCAAIRRNPRVRSLAHCDDISYTLEAYGFSYESISDERLTQLLEPLMRVAAEHQVLWEITGICPIRPLFQRARELGVRFTPTSDAHFIDRSWGPLTKWGEAADKLKAMGLEASPVVLIP